MPHLKFSLCESLVQMDVLRTLHPQENYGFRTHEFKALPAADN